MFEMVANLGFSCFDCREGGRGVFRSTGWIRVMPSRVARRV